MKTKKIFISLILCLSIVFCNINYVRANIGTGIIAFFNLFHSLENGEINNLLDFIDQTFTNSGLLGPKIPGDLQTLEDYVHEYYPELEGETSEETQENISDYLTTNISVDDNSNTYTFNDNSRSFFVNLSDYYIDNTKPSIYYAYDLQASQRYLNSNLLSDMAQIMSDNPNCYFGLRADNNYHYLYVYKPNGNKLYGVYKNVYGGYTNAFTFYQVKTVNGIVSAQEFTASSSDDLIVYRSNNTWNLEEIDVQYPYFDYNTDYYFWDIQPGQSCGMDNFRQFPISFTNNNSYIQTFGSLSALNDYLDTYGVGKNPYYYNNEVWSNFSNSTGDYTVTSSNVNTVTYGDVVSYVNDYHDTNNNYPDNSTVNTWIETTNNNNNSGGGSGDDSGGGSGGSGSDDSGSIFDWLKTLGKAIGDLISGVGNFLSEIVAGLVDAITNLLDAITTLITGVLESLTNIFSGLIEFIFAGLPDDIRNVLSLALTVAILISVLKLIRGN